MYEYIIDFRRHSLMHGNDNNFPKTFNIIEYSFSRLILKP